MNLKKYKVKNYSKDIETHEVFLDNLARKKELELGITGKRIEVPLHEQLGYLIFAIFIVFILILVGNVFWLQIVQGKNFSTLSDSNKTRAQYSQAERGVIYDSNLEQLVFNEPAFDLICDKRDLAILSSNIVEEIDNLAVLIDRNPGELKKQIEEEKDSKVLVYENIPHEILIILETKIQDFPGFTIESSTTRNYSSGSYSSQLLGYLSKVNKNDLRSYSNYSVSDYIGKTGLEKSYETILRGIPGVTNVEKDVNGREKGRILVSDPQSGKSLVLYLDLDLQKKLTEVLQDRIDSMNLRKAAAVAIDPRTGGILAMVSLPSFDNNIFSQGIDAETFKNLQEDPAQPFFNKAISGQYPTGSTIKPLIASAALQEGIISPTKEIYDPGYIEVKSQYDSSVVYRYSGLERPGYYNMRKAISESSNIYFYTIGGGYGDQQGLGPARIKKYLELFGWGQDTNIDLSNEASGFLPSPEWKKQVKGESWWDGDTYHLAIGQGGLTATPLQVASAFSAIANGGKLMEPHMVKEVVDTSTGSIKTVKETEPVIIRQDFIDSDNLKVVREGMRQGVTSSTGTGQPLQILPVAAASKTGTAQTSKDNVYDIWASVFAPYDNPQIVLVVLCEDVEGLHVPSLMVARDVLNWYFRR